MILNTIIPALQGKANKETHSHAQVFLCSDFFIIVANPPSGIEGKIIMGVFQKASLNKCKTTPKITTSAAATLKKVKKKL
jgi:hypothetical protein